MGPGHPPQGPRLQRPRPDAGRRPAPPPRDTDEQGRNGAALSGTAEAAARPEPSRPQPERYTASALIEVEPGATRRTVLSAGGKSVAVDRSTAEDFVAASDWHGTSFQRARQLPAPANGPHDHAHGHLGRFHARVCLNDGVGARIHGPASPTLAGYGGPFQRNTRASAVIPQSA
ncbi:hypothetical protein SMICM304S_01989 [Streptomyces microflavus]